MKDVIVPFLDFHAPYRELKEDLDAAYHRFMESGWFVLGREVAAFEEEYAHFCEAGHCVGVSNGLDALHLALRALDCGPGDEVIVPSNTYIATWLAVSQCGATPVPVEPDPATFNLNPAELQTALSSRTKVILPVNLYGQPCDYDPILQTARHAGVKVVIDNAQAQGARYRGRRVGGIADIECHSFYPSKNLGAFGEAGAITTNDPDLADRVRILRNYGSRVRYHNEVAGYNSRLDELQAAFLRVKLRHLDDWNTHRSKVAEAYQTSLSGLRNGTLPPTTKDWASHVWHLYVIRHPRRDELQRHLQQQGIQTIIHYPIPPHRSGAYQNTEISGGRHWDLPIADMLANEVLSLPIGPHMPLSHTQDVFRSLESFRP